MLFNSVKTYEVVLREHFKFRKKLEAGQWLIVARELDKWKQQGIECVVAICGKEKESRLVAKDIKRERRELACGKLKPRKAPCEATVLRVIRD